jgi:hypothetical protein
LQSLFEKPKTTRFWWERRCLKWFHVFQTLKQLI